MNRIEINVQTGERKVIELTPEEVADAQARAIAEANKPKEYTPLEFIDRFTVDERKAIRRAAKMNEDLEEFVDRLRYTSSVQTDSEALVNGIRALVNAGLLTAQRAKKIMGV